MNSQKNMNETSIHTIKSYSRDQILNILQTALATRNYLFARQTALIWMRDYPGDLPVNLLYAQALLKEDHPDQGLPILNDIYQIDPEYVIALETLLHAQKLSINTDQHKDPYFNKILGAVLALGGNTFGIKKIQLPECLLRWTRPLRQARLCLEDGKLNKAEEYVHQALAAQPDVALVAVTHLSILYAQVKAGEYPNEVLQPMAEHYHNRWAKCQHFSLLLAYSLMSGGNQDEAVSLLHKAASDDISGQVATRLWGSSHPYRNLWPGKLTIHLEVELPASVSAALDRKKPSKVIKKTKVPVKLNLFKKITLRKPLEFFEKKLSEAKTYIKKIKLPKKKIKLFVPKNKDHNIVKQQLPDDDPQPETIRSIQAELERVGTRLKQSSLIRSEGRFPVYVILTTRRGLEYKYGSQDFSLLDRKMKRLVDTVETRRNWNALLFYADDPSMAEKYGNKPAHPSDPWSIKLALTDLDKALERRGQMVGAVLIVGGPQVVPFHHLPNPVEDNDVDVPSDNPYSTHDENYFIPEWPVGRLPAGSSYDVKPLLELIDNLISHHKSLLKANRNSWINSLWVRLKSLLLRKPAPPQASIGYTADVWKKASQVVFQPIGKPRSLMVSPPIRVPDHQLDDHNFQNPATSPGALPNKSKGKPAREFLPAAKLGYFNLHGVADSVEWFGHRDPRSTDGSGDNIDFPVALRPQDIVNGGRSPQVVFSEACYGANIIGRKIDQAISLKFMQSGSLAVVGSTCTSYGSITPPLIAADLLGHSFWNLLRKNIPVGEALRRAKISLARDMHRKQGYIDGEDQKTLISFVLYGDPLAQPDTSFINPKSVLRPLNPPNKIYTVCEHGDGTACSQSLPKNTSLNVKEIVEQYLPGMKGAQLSVRKEHALCNQSNHNCPTGQMNKFFPKNNCEENQLDQPGRRVVILRKNVNSPDNNVLIHQQYARLTLDNNGDLVKMAVSR